MRPGSHNAHIAAQYIQELWELIQTTAPQKTADAGNACIIAGSLYRICICIHPHTSELQAPEAFIVFSAACLPEKDRAARFQFDQQANQRNEPAKNEHSHEPTH